MRSPCRPFLRHPVVHDDAVRHVDHASRRAVPPPVTGQRRPHGIQQRKCDRRAGAPQQRPPRKMFACDDRHLEFPPVAGRRDHSFGALSPHLEWQAVHDFQHQLRRTGNRPPAAPRRWPPSPDGRSAPDRGPKRRSAASRSVRARKRPDRSSGASSIPPGPGTCGRPAASRKRPLGNLPSTSRQRRSRRSSPGRIPADPSASGRTSTPDSCDAVPSAAAAKPTGPTLVSFRARHRGGGGGGGAFSRFSRIHLPRSTGEVRVEYDEMVRMLACASSRRRAASRSRRPCGIRAP